MRAHEHARADHHGRAFDFPLGQIRPNLLSGFAIQAIHALVPAGRDDQLLRQRRRREERLVIFRRLKAPKNIRLLPIDSQDLAAHGADEKLIARDGHRCPYLPAEVKRRPHFLAGGRVDDVERAIAPGGEGAIADDRRRAQHRTSRNLELPEQLAVF